jgi:hypothetical protein
MGFSRWHGVCWSIGVEMKSRAVRHLLEFSMLHALGAASAALEALKSLSSSKSSSSHPTGNRKEATNPFDLSGAASASTASTPPSGSSGGSQISPETMSALLAAQGRSTGASTGRSDILKDLFAQIDADADGQLSQLEFETALGAGGTNIAQADSVFGKLDKDGNGTVGLGEMLSALKGSGQGHHRDPHAADSDGTGGADSNPLPRALRGASTTSVTNSDGSITTSLTYGDGSKVTMTSAAAASSSATTSYNFIEKMIQRQAQAISASSAASLSVVA